MNDIGTVKLNISPEEIAEGDSEPAEQGLGILIANEQTVLAIDEARLIRAVQAVLADSAYPLASVSIALVDDATIQGLNAEFLGHNYPTDVLSFVLEDSPEFLEGELIVSTDTALRAAAEACWAAQDELLLYVLHGALHLIGYRDKAPDEQTEMRAAESNYLRKMGVALPAHQTRWQGVLLNEELLS